MATRHTVCCCHGNMERYRQTCDLLCTFPATWLATPAQTTRATENLWWPHCHSWNGWMDEKSPNLRGYWLLRYTGALSRPRYPVVMRNVTVGCVRTSLICAEVWRSSAEDYQSAEGVSETTSGSPASSGWSVRLCDDLLCSQEREKREHELKKAQKSQQKKPGFDGRWYTNPNAHLSHEWVSHKDDWLGVSVQSY